MRLGCFISTQLIFDQWFLWVWKLAKKEPFWTHLDTGCSVKISFYLIRWWIYHHIIYFPQGCKRNLSDTRESIDQSPQISMNSSRRRTIKLRQGNITYCIVLINKLGKEKYLFALKAVKSVRLFISLVVPWLCIAKITKLVTSFIRKFGWNKFFI